MACPDSMTTLDLSGTFTLNRQLSDPTDEVLRLQGLNWVLRKLIAVASVTVYVKHYKDEDGVEHMDIKQVGTGGLGNTEEYKLDWSDHNKRDIIFADVVYKSSRVKLEELEDEWQKEDWVSETEETGLIRTFVESDISKGSVHWITDLVWGFAIVDGIKKHIRRLRFVGPKGEIIHARVVFDYEGPYESK